MEWLPAPQLVASRPERYTDRSTRSRLGDLHAAPVRGSVREWFVGMIPEFRREYLLQLPLPLAQLYSRAHSARDGRSRHDTTFYLFEALIKLAAAPGIACYLEETEHQDRAPDLDRLLAHLALPSLGHWVAMLRALAARFADRPGPGVHPLAHFRPQLSAKRSDLPGVLALYRRVKNGPDGPPSGDRNCSLVDLLDALVQCRNAIFGHGGPRSEEYYAKEMG